jgi:hypothetical protein
VIMQEASSTEDDTILVINEPTSSDKLIIFDGLIDLYPARILIDSGSTNNYISELFVEQHNIYTSPATNSSRIVLANGIPLNVKAIASDVQLHIQDYIDELNIDVIPLTSYDMVLGMAWLEKYGPTIDHTSHTITFTHEGSTVILQPVLTNNVSSVTDDDTSLITDDQQLIVREGVPGAQSPHHYSAVNTVLYIILLVVLLAVYLGYTCAEKIAVSKVGMDTNETHMHTTPTSFVHTPLTRLLQPMSYLSSTLTIISILFGIYSFTQLSTINTSASNIVYAYIKRKAKKARPR